MRKSYIIWLLTVIAGITYLFFTSPTPSEAEHDGLPSHLETSETKNYLGPERQLNSPHGSFATNSNACGNCHQLHQGKAANLLREQSKRDTCFICHDGRGSKYDVKNGKYYNGAAGVVVDNVAGGFSADFSSSHPIDGDNGNNGEPKPYSPPGGNGQVYLVCTSCHNPHGTNNYRNLHTTVNGRSNVVVEATKSLNPFTNKETISYKKGIPNFCSSCHLDYVYYHDSVGASGLIDNPTKAIDDLRYRHPIGVTLNGGKRPAPGSEDIPQSAKFDPTLFTTLPTEGVPSGAYPNPSTTVETTAGSLTTGYYYYIVTALNALGESHQGFIKTVQTTSASSKVNLMWENIVNATGYKVYRSSKFTAAVSNPNDRSQLPLSSFSLLADSSLDKTKFSGSDTITFVDTGLSGTASSPPEINSQQPAELQAKVFCLTCHYAHGTKTTDSFTGQSKLKRIDNMGVCQNCHKR